MLNPEKIWHKRITDLSTSLVRCSHLTLGNPDVFQHYYLYISDYLLAQKKTNGNCCTAALAVYLLLFSASYYLHSPSTASAVCYRRSAHTDMDMLMSAAAACCDMGWISAQCGVLWKHVLMQKVVALSTCCDVQSHQQRPTNGSF